jgi:hypothetical protein
MYALEVSAVQSGGLTIYIMFSLNAEAGHHYDRRKNEEYENRRA